MGLSEEALGGGRAIGTPDREVVQSREHLLLTRAQTMMPMLIEREDAVAALDTGAAALKQIGTVPGDLLEVSTGLLIQRLDRVRGLLQRGEPLLAQVLEPMALLSPVLRAAARSR